MWDLSQIQQTAADWIAEKLNLHLRHKTSTALVNMLSMNGFKALFRIGKLFIHTPFPENDDAESVKSALSSLITSFHSLKIISETINVENILENDKATILDLAVSIYSYGIKLERTKFADCVRNLNSWLRDLGINYNLEENSRQYADLIVSLSSVFRPDILNSQPLFPQLQPIDRCRFGLTTLVEEHVIDKRELSRAEAIIEGKVNAIVPILQKAKKAYDKREMVLIKRLTAKNML